MRLESLVPRVFSPLLEHQWHKRQNSEEGEEHVRVMGKAVMTLRASGRCLRDRAESVYHTLRSAALVVL